MSPAISVQKLSKRFRLGEHVGNQTFREALSGLFRRRQRAPAEALWALQDVSFEVARGEVLGVIGRNGAGKSTLLKILTGITEPTSGRVELNGRVASLLEVGTGFHGELTGRENVFLNGSILGMSRNEIKSKFDEIVAFSGVEKFLDTPVKRYSSGMYMRLAFSVAAHLEQEILLVDEVLAVGDAEFQKKCLGKMGEVASAGRTVLFVSHNMGAVQRLCHRCLLLKHGHIAQTGSAEDVVQSYLAPSDDETGTLANRSDRQGDGRARFTEVTFTAPDGAPAGTVLSGQGLRIHLGCEAKEPGMYHVVVGLFSAEGSPLTYLSTRYDNDYGAGVMLSGRQTIVCEVPHLALAASDYRVNLVLWHADGVRSDWVENAASLHVDSGDYFGSGQQPPASSGHFLVAHHWLPRS